MQILSATLVSATRAEIAALVKFTTGDKYRSDCRQIVFDPANGAAYATTGQIALVFQGQDKFPDAKRFWISRDAANRAARITGADEIVIECDHEKNRASLTVYDEFDPDFHDTKQGLELAVIAETGSGTPVDMQIVIQKYPFREGAQSTTSNPFVNPKLLAPLTCVGKLSVDRFEGLEISTGEEIDDAILFRTRDKRWTAYVMPMNPR